MKLIRYIVLFSIVCLVFFGTIFFYLIHSSIINQDDFYYLLKPGTSAQLLANDLHKQADLPFPIVFRIVARLQGSGQQLQAGEYIFEKGNSIVDIINTVTEGRVLEHSFMIVNGWNIHKVRQVLNQLPAIQHTTILLTDAELAKQLNITQSSPEGWFYPETYYYVYGTTDLALLKRAHQQMQDVVEKAWHNRKKSSFYRRPYQALIVASMLEKETHIPAEKPIIASVILKRLQQWMPLQIDATVIYGLGDGFTGNLTRKDLQQKTPYNTYKKYGLPPTPICMPSKESINAALHPVLTNALYFVAKGDGTHIFSETLKDQQRAISETQMSK